MLVLIFVMYFKLGGLRLCESPENILEIRSLYACGKFQQMHTHYRVVHLVG